MHESKRSYAGNAPVNRDKRRGQGPEGPAPFRSVPFRRRGSLGYLLAERVGRQPPEEAPRDGLEESIVLSKNIL